MPNIYSPFTILEDERAGPNDLWIDVQLATFAKIRDIAEGRRGPMAFVWPDEGAFRKDGETWRFNDKHEGFEPLLLDHWSSTALVAVHDALSTEERRDRMRDFIQKDRGGFGGMFELAEKTVKISFGQAGGA